MCFADVYRGRTLRSLVHGFSASYKASSIFWKSFRSLLGTNRHFLDEHESGRANREEKLLSGLCLVKGDNLRVPPPDDLPEMKTAVLLLSCPSSLARRGVVAAISSFIVDHGGGILHADDHPDNGQDLFFSRLEWDRADFALPLEKFEAHFKHLAERFLMKYRLALSLHRPRVAILVSNYDHCLADLLYRHHNSELACDIAIICSNHPTGERLAEFYKVPFLAVVGKEKQETERKILAALREHEVELIVLARYMQILSPEFVQQYEGRIRNIHHSYLPAFVGARPYHQALDRGVKLIGATSHYVNAGLDQGPIVEQDVVRISHRDTIANLIQKGRDLEKLVLARAVRWHLEHRVLICGNKTVVFS
jgi:formyltetrahydrofolate deformylase